MIDNRRANDFMSTPTDNAANVRSTGLVRGFFAFDRLDRSGEWHGWVASVFIWRWQIGIAFALADDGKPWLVDGTHARLLRITRAFITITIGRMNVKLAVRKRARSSTPETPNAEMRDGE